MYMGIRSSGLLGFYRPVREMQNAFHLLPQNPVHWCTSRCCRITAMVPTMLWKTTMLSYNSNGVEDSRNIDISSIFAWGQPPGRDLVDICVRSAPWVSSIFAWGQRPGQDLVDICVRPAPWARSRRYLREANALFLCYIYIGKITSMCIYIYIYTHI